MNRRIGKFGLVIVASCFFQLFADNSFAIELGELSGKIAFLKDGEVWISDLGGNQSEQITSDSGRVDDFLFSPSLGYLAYARIIEYRDEPGLRSDSDKVPQVPVCSIVIMDLRTREIMKEIMPPADPWIYMSKWLPDDKLLFYSSSGFDVSGFYTYDLKNDIEKELDYNEGNKALETDFSSDGTLMAYVDESGLGKDFRENIHLVNLKTKVDRVVVSKRSIADQTISNDDNRIAFVEVEDHEAKYFDNLWMYDFRDDSLKSLYIGPALPMAGGVNEVSWSFDDRYIGMFFSPEALVIDTENPGEVHRIEGTHFGWTGNNKIIFVRGNDTYLYDLVTGKSEMLLKGAVKPVYLMKKAY